MKQEAVKGTCVDCGGIFFYIRGGRIPVRCPKCQRAKEKENYRKWYAENRERLSAEKRKHRAPKPKPKKKAKRESLTEACRKARELGISYGKYKALQYLKTIKQQKEKSPE